MQLKQRAQNKKGQQMLTLNAKTEQNITGRVCPALTALIRN